MYFVYWVQTERYVRMLGEEEELSSKRKVDKHLPKGWLNFGGDFWGRRRSQSHHTLSLIIIFLLLP